MKVYLNNRNWLTSLKAMVDDIRRMGGEPIVVDNNSTYPPLLDYYKHADHQVVRLNVNAGQYAPWLEGAIDRQEQYVVSDSDLDLRRCPDDTLQHLQRLSTRYPDVKVGLSLILEPWNGIPIPRNIVKIESAYWKKEVADAYVAGVDTTFAMYTSAVNFAAYHGVRTKPPYSAFHLGWYYNDTMEGDLGNEIRYYRKHAASSVHSSAAHLHGHRAKDTSDLTWRVGLTAENVKAALASGRSVHLVDTGVVSYTRPNENRRVVSFCQQPLAPEIRELLHSGEVTAVEESPSTGSVLPSHVHVWAMFNFGGMNPAMREVAEHFCDGLKEAGISHSISGGHQPGVNVIIGAHGAPPGFEFPDNCIILNTEQNVSCWTNDPDVYRRVEAVFNYEAKAHARFTAAGIRSIPCYYGTTTRMENAVVASKPLYDVFFAGRVTPYRKAVLQALRAQGVRVFSNEQKLVFGEERDQAMLASKVVLNLKTFEDSIFTPVRLLPAMAAGRCIVTDPFDGQDLYDFGGGVVIASANTIVERIVRLLTTGDWQNVGARAKEWSATYRYAEHIQKAFEAYHALKYPPSVPILSQPTQSTQPETISSSKLASCTSFPDQFRVVNNSPPALDRWLKRHPDYHVQKRGDELWLERTASRRRGRLPAQPGPVAAQAPVRPSKSTPRPLPQFPPSIPLPIIRNKRPKRG